MFLYKVQKLGPRDGQGFGIKPLFSVGAKGAESGVKGRQIRRPFHSDVCTSTTPKFYPVIVGFAAPPREIRERRSFMPRLALPTTVLF